VFATPFGFQPLADWAVTEVKYATVPAPVERKYTNANGGETVCV
jgi:hypothetical protein